MHKPTQSALIAIRRILRATEFSARNLSRDSGISPSQLIVLQFLRDRGEATPTEIAKHAFLTQATVTSLIDKLERRALVARRPDAKDGRRVLVSMTPAGRKTLNQSQDALQVLFERRFEALEPWEKSFLVAALERIAAMLDAAEIDAAPVLDVGEIDKPVKKVS